MYRLNQLLDQLMLRVLQVSPCSVTKVYTGVELGGCPLPCSYIQRLSKGYRLARCFFVVINWPLNYVTADIPVLK